MSSGWAMPVQRTTASTILNSATIEMTTKTTDCVSKLLSWEESNMYRLGCMSQMYKLVQLSPMQKAIEMKKAGK